MRLAARTTLAGVPRGRRRIGLLSLSMLPVLVMLLVLTVGDGGRGTGFANFALTVTDLYLGLILPLVVIFLGTATFGDEWAGGTACYVLGVPLSRRALVVGRWLACTRRALLYVLPPVAGVFVLCLVGFGDALFVYLSDLGWVLLVLGVLAAAYGALFILMGLALKRAVMTSLFYVFFSEMVLSRMPQSLAVVSLDFHARNLIWQFTGRADFEPRTMPTEVAVEPVTVVTSVTWMVLFTLGSLALSAWLLARKEAGGEVQAAASAET